MVSSNQEVELEVQVTLRNSHTEDLDHFARQLYSEMRELDVESVESVKSGPAPADSKALDVVLIGSWLVKLAPTVIPPLLALLKDWTARHPTVPLKLKVKRGQRTVEIEYDPEKTSLARVETLANRLLK